MKQLLLLHGALGTHHDLEPLSAELEQNGFQVNSFSFSGHGTSAFSDDFGIDTFSSELEKYIIDNSLARPAVFGYSMGGFVALNLSKNKPQLLGKIVTLGTKFRWTMEVVEKETKILDPQVMTAKVPALAEALRKKHGDNFEPLLSKTAEMMRSMEKIDHLDATSLSKIEIPVLLGLGDKDKMVTYDETLHVFKSIPGSGMYMLPHTPHAIEAVKPELLAKIISGFVAN
ncbi:MAG: glyoxalase family protein [Bacteroidetes bacterium]|nr:glyoxalase family protein [Bacteroidota bacterium]